MKRKVIQNYTLLDVLGEGSFGKVHQGINNRTNELFAVKVIPIQKFQQNSKLEQCSANEIRNLTRIDPNPHIIKFVEMLKTPNNFYFVYEFCNGKTLDARLKEEIKLPEREALRIFAQLLEAFKVLNKYNIMHRDLKPDNIFFHNGNIKLGDFGFCKTLLREGDMTSTMLGSPIYMAPEVLRGQIYTSKADIWSLGVVLYEMLFGVCPFESNSIAKLIATLDNTELRFPFEISASTKSLLKKLLTKDQFKRIDWFELLTINLNLDQKQASSASTLSRQSSTSSISILEKKIEELRVIDLTGSRTPLSVQAINLPINSAGYIFKKKSDSASKYNPQCNKIQKRSSQTPTQSKTQSSTSIHNVSVQYNPSSAPAILRKTSLPLKGQIKRKQLLSDHHSCLLAVKTAMNLYTSNDHNSPLYSYILFKRVQYVMKRLIDSISINQPQLQDIQSTASSQLLFIQKQCHELQLQVKKLNINPSEIVSTKMVLKQRFITNSNIKLWYEMIMFLTENKINPRASEIEWNEVINNYLT